MLHILPHRLPHYLTLHSPLSFIKIHFFLPRTFDFISATWIFDAWNLNWREDQKYVDSDMVPKVQGISDLRDQAFRDHWSKNHLVFLLVAQSPLVFTWPPTKWDTTCKPNGQILPFWKHKYQISSLNSHFQFQLSGSSKVVADEVRKSSVRSILLLLLQTFFLSSQKTLSIYAFIWIGLFPGIKLYLSALQASDGWSNYY